MNKKTFTTKKKAFSLIELSIVLIIIGLLVAGVTGGASLIKNSELRGLMTEARGYQTAVNAFNERFQALPGDYGTVVGGTFTNGSAVASNCAVTNGVCGNGNGQIEFYAAANTTVGATSATVGGRMEGNIAWQQLKNGGFIDATFTPATGDAGDAGVVNTTTLTPGTNIPGSKVKNLGWIFDTLGNNLNFVIATASFAGSGAANANAVVASPAAIIIPVDALSVDTKTDDGVANTGKVRANAATAGCNSTGTYTTATSTAACALMFQVDPNV
jgi:prepilin-type N-terminal cleavage/methylation domain-containing protein